MSADSLPNLRKCGAELCCEGPEGALKATLLDTLSVKQTWMAAGAFFFCVFLTLIIGGAGPSVTASPPNTYLVSAPSDPTLQLTFTLAGLNKWQQATWLVASLQRPVVSEGGPYFQAAQPLTFPVTWTLVASSADGVRTPVNSSHITQVFCPPSQATCRGFAIFSQALGSVSRYDLEVSMVNPYASFNLPAQAVVLSMMQGNVNEKYTEFGELRPPPPTPTSPFPSLPLSLTPAQPPPHPPPEAGFKVFYCTFSMLIWLYYVWRLRRGQGTHDSEGQPLSSTHEQKWLMYLGLALFFFNDPNFITYLASPSVAGAGFSALCAATFVALLLFFFLCLADNARQGGDAGFSYHHVRALRVKGACFWVPKVLICSIIWATSLALYVFQRLSNMQDPSFTFSDTFSQAQMSVLTNFVLGIGILYILYLFTLLVLAFRAFRTASPSSRFLLTVSVTTLLLVLVGLFSQGFVATRAPAIVFLAAYGVPTVYVWTLLLLLLPAPHPPSWTANTQGAFAAPPGALASQPPPSATLPGEEWGRLPPEAQFAAFRELQEYVVAVTSGAGSSSGGGGGGGGGVGGRAGGSSEDSSSGAALEAAERGGAKGHDAVALPNAAPVEAEEIEVEGAHAASGSKWT